MSPEHFVLPEQHHADARILWDYHDLRHELRPCDVGIGLGSRNLSVADFAAALYHQGLVPYLAFTGGIVQATVDRFPRGEAVHFRERALELDVPDEAILVEPKATNTGENIEFTRQLLIESGIRARSVLLISRPYQQRRAFATCKKRWPEVEVVCAARRLSLDEYLGEIADPGRVLHMLVGDTQRITLYAERGFAIPQPVPADVAAAYQRLVDAGYTGRMFRG